MNLINEVAFVTGWLAIVSDKNANELKRQPLSSLMTVTTMMPKKRMVKRELKKIL